MLARILQGSALIWISLLFAGCASKESVLPTPEHTMKEVYENHSGQSSGLTSGVEGGRQVLRRPATEDESDIRPYIRTEANYLKSTFKTLPNPTLYMFVAPHLSTNDRVPVPGYITEFQMYERTEYALPGEVANYN